MTQEMKKWFDMANTDLGVAKHLNKTYHPKPLEIVCYHCQQSAEKNIKALIIYCKLPGGLPKIHDLSFLLNQLKNQIKIADIYYDYADALTPYGVAIRYPNELFLTEKHAQEAIKNAEAILEWTSTIIQTNIVSSEK